LLPFALLTFALPGAGVAARPDPLVYPHRARSTQHLQVADVGALIGRKWRHRELLEWFFSVHRPDLDEDLVGFNYRSEIFCTTSDQRDVAEETLRDVDSAGLSPMSCIHTPLTPLISH
jgi:peptide methionine sulfoxide reductase MsrA